MKVFQQEKELFWRDNAALTEEELQERWAVETSKFRSLLGTAATEATPRHAIPPSAAPNVEREPPV